MDTAASSSFRALPVATLDIDLAAIAHNYLFLKGKLKKGADCSAVVKADAYGLGVGPVAKALYSQSCRHFFVATFDEGVAVRAALAPEGQGAALVYVLHGPNGANAADFVAHGLIPVLNTLPDIADWSAFAAASGKKQPCILHVDTGMNRLGLGQKEAAGLRPEELKALDVRYVMSHLACPDTPDHPMNRAQLEAFSKVLPGPYPRSLANSAGILLGQEWHFDLARPGCGLYGMNPRSDGTPNPLKPVVTLKGRVLQVREIEAPGTVGYGATQRVTPPAKTAAISLGYADGYFRSLTGRSHVWVGGVKCPVIGRVSMDSIVADVSALATPPRPGDMAEIIGPHQTVEDMAAQAGTINYEVLTSLGKRYKRTYTGA